MLLFYVFLLFSISTAALADTLKLKDGRAIEGNILEETADHIKIDVDGTPVTYYDDQIDHIETPTATGIKVRYTKHQQEKFNQEAENDLKSKTVSDPKGMALIKAASEGDVEQIRQLIAEKVDLNVLSGLTGMEQTPLTAAANKGQLEAVKILTENGADINKPGFLGWPPIAHAANNGHIEIVKYLVDKGANLTFNSPMGGSLLDIAKKYPDIIKLLQDAGAK